jgi:nicotinate phosphoribosyltransferase
MIYNTSLGLMTDLYQLTMAYGYWKHGMSGRRATFNLFFRKAPFNNGFAVACGLQPVVDLIETLKQQWFSQDDCDYLATLMGNDGNPLFDQKFLEYLGGLKFTCNILAIEEGTPVYAHEPLLSITGPLDQCQLLETPLLNLINFNTLIATKAYRTYKTAKGDVVFDFGLRRAQGFDGALSASRAAYIGGCFGTSNVLAGKLFDIPVKGTHAHSWVMSFDSELEAMMKYVEALPNNATLLVDTYGTIGGVMCAIEAGKTLRKTGHDLYGIRLDSGNLCELSKIARQMLDAAGFKNTVIVASNDLDEDQIARLKSDGAKINAWGVGTKLITSYDQPALGGVYKLAVLENEKGESVPKIKLSESISKTSIPGAQQILRRISKKDYVVRDIIYDTKLGFSGDVVSLDADCDGEDNSYIFHPYDEQELLIPVYENGSLVYVLPTIHHSRAKSINIDNDVFRRPNVYIDKKLNDIRNELILAHK